MSIRPDKYICHGKKRFWDDLRTFGIRGLASDFHFICQDISNPLKTSTRFDFIIHAATSAHPMAYASDPVGIMTANFDGARNLLSYMTEHPESAFYMSLLGGLWSIQ